MATGTNLEQDLTMAGLREAAARRAQDDTLAEYWRNEALRISDRIWAMERAKAWDVCKGASRG